MGVRRARSVLIRGPVPAGLGVRPRVDPSPGILSPRRAAAAGGGNGGEGRVRIERPRRGDGKASAGVLHPAGIGDAIVPGEMTGQRMNRSTLTSRSNCY